MTQGEDIAATAAAATSLHYALGRLEGRVGSLENKLDNLDTRTDRQLNAVAGKMSALEKVVGELRTTLHSSWHTVAIIGASVFAIGTFVVSVMNLLHH